MKTLKQLKNTKGYENLEEYLGKELGSLIYKTVDEATKWDAEIDIWHKHVGIIQNTMVCIAKDPIDLQLKKAFKEIAAIGKEYVEIKCPECLCDVEQSELDAFGGLCEGCNSDL
jgi:hypothetical protein